MHSIYKRILPLFLVSALVVSCGKKSTPVTAPSAEAPPASPQAAAVVEEPTVAAQPTNSLVGSWEGNSGTDLPISFTVEGNQVTSLSASYSGYKEGGCSFSGN